ncbi:YdcF family protein [Cyanobium sp. CH-040]|uniref:YdcF family protein n=1 Tax=Cyanobium sp. CH-040 TaxID=2823708 RepID=UPI0020CCAED3|nr:YdcF family protein [Cyanobium sp. CH-040]MCP9926585.1 YdcF family protein [Cyanobium sp. CH-040]
MGFLLSKLLPLLVYPLGLGVALGVAGLLGRRRRWGPWVGGAGLGVIWLFAMPLTSRQLIWGLEERAGALMPAALPRADAVVVLGGGLRPPLPPRSGVEVAEGGDRLLTGVRLLRQEKAALLVTSGSRVSFTSGDPAPPEAAWARDLAVELGVPRDRILLNPLSRTTAEEARHIGELAERRGWRRILLVTSAYHLPRAVETFRRDSALEVVPVASDFQLPARAQFGRPTAASLALDLLPQADALELSTVAIKEHLGSLTYALRGGLGTSRQPGP